MQSPGSNRIPAFLAYLLLVIGWLYVLLLHRHDKLAVYHTWQAIMLVVAAVLGFLVWAVLGWVILIIPLVGPFITAATFSLVIGLYIALVISWLVGMVYALQAKAKPIPFVGRWAERWSIK